MLNKILFAASVCLLASGLAKGTVLNVDFNTPPQGTNANAGTYVGTAVAPDTGTFWNGVTLPGSTGTTSSTTILNPLKYSDGTTAATGISFSVSAYNALNAQGNYSNTVGWTNTIAPDLFGDLVYNNGSPTFSINGLSSANTYDLYLYSMTGYPNANDTTFTVAGVAGSTHVTGLPATYGAAFDDATTDSTGNYVLYQNVPVSASAISGTFGGTNIRFNGFQLVTYVPEPSSIALIGFAAAGLTVRARRR